MGINWTHLVPQTTTFLLITLSQKNALTVARCSFDKGKDKKVTPIGSVPVEVEGASISRPGIKRAKAMQSLSRRHTFNQVKT